VPLINAPPSFVRPVSQVCTQAQFQSPEYRQWCRRIGEEPRLHRKQWEFCYILQALDVAGMLAPGRRGVGYGVGEEPLPSLMAAIGCEILATDLDVESASRKGWVETNQHAFEKARLNARGLCDEAQFSRLVDFRVVDMNHIPEDIGRFDFTWSACALEHLGSIDAGLAFIENTIATLRPGGVAVHTTELNCSSDNDTLDAGGTVLFRRKDLIEFCRKLERNGCGVTFNLYLGNLPMDHFVDTPPYSSDKHLKLQIDKYVTTSVGLIIQAAH
jgi:SAM-dependent methyltransferase